MFNLSSFSYRIAIMLLSTISLTGCVTSRFSEPITSLRDSINTSGTAIGVYYAELNKFEREIYLDECLYDPNMEVSTTDNNGNPTPLIGSPFSAESIKARTDAIEILGVYAQRLGELAGSEAPKQFAEGSKILGDNLFNLQVTFDKLGKSDEEKKIIDKTAKNYSGPIGTIVGVIGRMYLEKQRDDAIKKAIEDGAPEVRKVLILLQNDLTSVIDPLKRIGLKEKLAHRAGYFNENRNTVLNIKDNFAQRKQTLAEIDAAASRYEAALTANPANLIQTMLDTHESLVKYAGSPKTPQNFTELLAALETFKSRAQEIADAVKQIRDLRKGG
ncbi:conserved hypothetical protein [Candidatus Brocadia pituitae]|nr:conserved hypothetical protein [Candidatus Brocadia pituitae]